MDRKIVIFSKPGCKYCVKTKEFFEELNIRYEEINLNPDHPGYIKKRDDLFRYYNHYSYPIIVIDNVLLGGYTELINSYDTLRLHELCEKINIDIPYDF